MIATVDAERLGAGPIQGAPLGDFSVTWRAMKVLSLIRGYPNASIHTSSNANRSGDACVFHRVLKRHRDRADAGVTASQLAYAP